MSADMLFGETPPEARKGAVLSAEPVPVYRYELTRDWSDPNAFLRQFVTFVMLNPSDADHLRDDPTIRLCMKVARRWGFHGIQVVNLYAFRASKPDVMWAAERSGVDIVGPDNNHTLTKALLRSYNTAAPVIVAWGNGGATRRVDWLIREAERMNVDLQCLGVTQSGAPKHPLARGHHRIPADVMPARWESA